MKETLFKSLRRFFSSGRSQPLIVPKQGENPTKKDFGVPRKSLQARRKASRRRQKMARRANRE